MTSQPPTWREHLEAVGIGEDALRSLLTIKQHMDAVNEVHQTLTASIMERLAAFIPDAVDRSMAQRAVFEVVECGSLDAILRKIDSEVECWTDDDGHRFDASLAELHDYCR